MSHAEARSWWVDVEHLREAAERRQAADRGRHRRTESERSRSVRDEETAPAARARARAVARVQEAGDGQVDELSARRAVTLDESAPRPRRPVPIWLADEAFGDSVEAVRARASAPRRTVEIRGQMVTNVAPRPPLGIPGTEVGRESRRRDAGSLGAAIASRPDRAAFWAFALGLALALSAALTAH